MRIEKWQWIIIAVIIAVVIGGSILGSQILKQQSIERQAAAKLEYEKQQDTEAKLEKSRQEFALSSCLSAADADYWDYMRINGEEDEDGTIWAQNSVWDRAAKTKKADEDVCYKKYK